MLQAKCYLVLSYVVKELEIAMLNTDTQLLQFIACNVFQDAYSAPNHMSTKYGMSVDETLRGLFNLSANDKNKQLLVELGQ